MFGAKITNNKGSTIIGDGERGFLYWGKKTITLSSASNWETGSTYLTLFNIPSSVPVTLFAVSNSTGGAGALILLDSSQPILRIRCMANTACTVDVYVFVDAHYVPKSTYGMIIFDNDSTVKWHSSRPAISYKDIRVETDNNNALNIITTTYKPAVQVGGTYASAMIYSSPSGDYDGYVWHFSARTGGGYAHMMKLTRVIGYTGGYFKGEYYAYNTNDLAVTYFTIDASFYDQFTNLPNYT